MANLLIGGVAYNNVNTIRILAEDGSYANYKYSHMGENINANLVKAIHSSGTQYINLGRIFSYPSDRDYELYFKFAMRNASKTQIIYGTNHSTASNNGDKIVVISGGVRFDRVNQARKSIQQNQIYVYRENNGSVEFDGSNVGTVDSAMRDINDKYAFLFAMNAGNGPEAATIASMSFYEFYYKENGVDVIHLYPVLDEDGTPCLFDTVSNTYLYNAGSGNFGYTAIDGTSVDPS